MPRVFVIPNRVLSNKAGYQYIADLYHQMLKDNTDKYILDFQNCQNFDANLAAVLGVIIDHYRSHREFYADNLSSGVRRALARNGFLHVLQPNETNLEEKENYVKYTCFQRGAADQFKGFIDEWIMKKQRFPKHTQLAGEKISETLYELYVNAITHGESERVYVCGEYLSRAGNRLCFTIVDKGRTIPKNVNDFFLKEGRPVVDSCDAIQWAFKSGNTTKNSPGGLGLALLQDFIQQNDGAMQMVSADGFLEFRNGEISTSILQSSFPGTIVNLEFNFDDTKNYYMTSEIKKDSFSLL